MWTSWMTLTEMGCMTGQLYNYFCCLYFLCLYFLKLPFIFQSSRLVRDMIENKGSRLVVSINDLRNQNKERAFSLLDKSFEEVASFQRALKEFVGSIDASYAKETEDFFIGFEVSYSSFVLILSVFLQYKCLYFSCFISSIDPSIYTSGKLR